MSHRPSILAFSGALACALLGSQSDAIAAAPAGGLVGAWSTLVPGQGGMTQVTESFDADNHFVSVRREPNGTMLRVWGSYRSAAVSPTQVRLESRVEGWAPRQICAQAPGFPVKCNPFTPPSPQPVVLDFISAEAFRTQGFVVRRDPDAALLRQTVQDRLVLAAPAPSRPIIAGPATGGGSRYVTPFNPAGGSGRDDLQQRRICSINGGNLVVASGRLTCVN